MMTEQITYYTVYSKYCQSEMSRSVGSGVNTNIKLKRPNISSRLCYCWLFYYVVAADYLQAVQATSVLACVFTILALFVFVAQLFTLPKGMRFTFTGILQIIACKLPAVLFLLADFMIFSGGCATDKPDICDFCLTK